MLSAFIPVCIVGFSTFVSGFLALFFKKFNNPKFLSIVLGTSVGTTVYIAISKILYESKIILLQSLIQSEVKLTVAFSFLIGITFAAVLDHLIPINIMHQKEELYKNELSTLLAVFLYGIPVGLILFLALLVDIHFVIGLIITILVHNIPKGVSIAIPIYNATNSKIRAIFYTFISSFAEISGAILGMVFLNTILSDTILGILFVTVAGMMLYTTVNELLPASRCCENGHLTIIGFSIGIILMVIICC